MRDKNKDKETLINNFITNKTALIGFIIFITVFLCCFILPLFYPLDKTYQDTTQQNVPPSMSMLKFPKELNGNVKEIDSGSIFSVGLETSGKIHQWGVISDELKKVPTVALKSVSAGLDHVLGLTNSGKIVTWGSNRFGLSNIPNELNSKDIKQIEAGYQFSTALTQDGHCYFWGNEMLISLNQNAIEESGIQGKIKMTAASSDNILFLLNDGTITVLGVKGTTLRNIPDISDIIKIAACDKAAAALTSDGKIYVWGSNEYNGVLLEVPTNIQGRAVDLTAGRYHFTALLKDGTVTVWGKNNFGQINNSFSGINKVYSGYFTNYAVNNEGKIESWGLNGYLMGTDAYGRDIFTRLLSGGRLTLTVGAVAVFIQVIIGVVIGGIAGYYGGKTDIILMRFAEIVGSIPFLPLAMTLSAVIGNRMGELGRIILIMVILGILGWSGLAFLVRGQILAEREKEFVTAAKAIGIREIVIIFRHILPNVLTVIIVNATLSYAGSLLVESSLSFLGFGVIEPSATWGNMLTGSQSSLVISSYWWRWVFPAAALALSTISINLIGDGLREAVDPKSGDR